VDLVDRDACYRALQTRDPRFDGRLFVGVTSTGIYCRPVCPASPARLAKCRFFASAAAAQEAGFRPCLRCRPETAPDSGSWRGTSSTVARGLSLIAQGELDESSVEALAERLGVGGRHLRRLFQEHLGASPIAVAQTRRILFAKQLIHETRLPMAEIALASGFGSIRRFNETFQRLFGRPPSALRATSARPAESIATGVTVHLRYRAPYDWSAMLAYLEARAIEGVERVREGRYRRTLAEGEGTGWVEIGHLPESQSLEATIRLSHLSALPKIVARVRRLFDLQADAATIATHLGRDPLLAPLVRARAGLRVPGAWDGFEVGVRAIVGQQVSVSAARGLAAQLVRLAGRRIELSEDDLHFLFPNPSELATADLTRLGMPAARRQALTTLARAAIADPHLFEPRATSDETVAELASLAGVGEWTAQYVAMRAAHEPDAFPASDAALLRSVSHLTGARPSPTELRQRAEAWRPWRAYAAQHLWTAASSGDSP
jgi:AraC family transcriptional regulator, regulatory protein of adaptative response / DNA-3-methyladenine glycosylase II